jgi:hypothetical protein
MSVVTRRSLVVVLVLLLALLWYVTMDWGRGDALLPGFFGWAAGLVVLLVLVYLLAHFLVFLYYWAGDCPLLIVVVLVLLQIDLGILLPDYGIPSQFRPPVPRWENWLSVSAFEHEGRTQLLSGIAVALLFGWIALIVTWQTLHDLWTLHPERNVASELREQNALLRRTILPPIFLLEPLLRRGSPAPLEGEVGQPPATQADEPAESPGESAADTREIRAVKRRRLLGQIARHQRIPTAALCVLAGLPAIVDLPVGLQVLVIVLLGIAAGVSLWLRYGRNRRLAARGGRPDTGLRLPRLAVPSGRSWELRLSTLPRVCLVVAAIIGGWWTIGLATGYFVGRSLLRGLHWWALRSRRIRGLVLFGPHEARVRAWESLYGADPEAIRQEIPARPHWTGAPSIRQLGDELRYTVRRRRFLLIPLGVFFLAWLAFQLASSFPQFLLSARLLRTPTSVVFCVLLFLLTGLYAWVRSYDSIRSRLAYLLGFLAIVFIVNGTDLLGPDAYKLRYPSLGLDASPGGGPGGSYYEQPATLDTQQYLDGSFLTVYPVVNATFATPIVLTSAVEHNLTDGQRVQVSGVRGNPNANGTYTVTVLDEHRFTLDGSRGNGTYQGDGVWYAVPDLGLVTDLRVQATVNGVPVYEVDSFDHGLKDGDQVELYGFRDPNGLNGRRFAVDIVDPNRFRFFDPDHAPGPYTWGGHWRQVNRPLPRGGILEASHTEPIVIHSPRHGLTGGEMVEIEGVPLNVNANGIHRVTVVDADHFALRNSWGVAGSQVGGTWRVVEGKGRVLDATNMYRRPIRIRSEGHGLNLGDRVEIHGVRGNVRANGIFAVERRGDDWFELRALLGYGDARFDYAGGGAWSRLSRREDASPRGEIVAVSNARGLPILVRSPSHSLRDGDRVAIRGVNPRANRVFTIDQVDGDSFVLSGSVASGDPADDYNATLAAPGLLDSPDVRRRMGGQWERVDDRGAVMGLRVEVDRGATRLVVRSLANHLDESDHISLIGLPGLTDEMLYAVVQVPNGEAPASQPAAGKLVLGPDEFVVTGSLGEARDLRLICEKYNKYAAEQGPPGHWRRFRGRGPIVSAQQDAGGLYRVVSPRHGLYQGDRVVVRDAPWSQNAGRAFVVEAIPDPRTMLPDPNAFLLRGIPRTTADHPSLLAAMATSAAQAMAGWTAPADVRPAVASLAPPPAASESRMRGGSWIYVTGRAGPPRLQPTRAGEPAAHEDEPSWTMGRPGTSLGESFREARVDAVPSRVDAGVLWTLFFGGTPGAPCFVRITAPGHGLRDGERLLIAGAQLWPRTSSATSLGVAPAAEPIALSTLHAAVESVQGDEATLAVLEPVERWNSSMREEVVRKIRRGRYTMDGLWTHSAEQGWGTIRAPEGPWRIDEKGPVPAPDARIIATGLEGSRSVLRVSEADTRGKWFGLEVPLDVQPGPTPKDAMTEPAGTSTTTRDAGGGSEAMRPQMRWRDAGLLSNSEVLTSWLISRQRRMPGESRGPETGTRLTRKPKLVLIAVSGGGIFSAVWTAVVLREIEAKIPEFPYHVRLVTGASGGMLGAAYYVASLRPPDELGRVRREVEPDARLVKDLEQDYLTPVANQMILGDLPGMLIWPFTNTGDRGRSLESSWIDRTGGPERSPLNRPFRDLAGGELAGWRPSLVFTPMLVEDGRRLLISNLNLDVIPRNVGPNLNPPEELRISRSARTQRLGVDEPFDIYSLSAVEFFRLFPGANAFKLSTAVRMSAAFPWVAPSVALPTDPPRSVVDAGYYDNFGVNLAAFWIFNYRDWLSDNTSGVLLIQVRASQYERERRELNPQGGVERSSSGLVGSLRRSGWVRPQLLERLFFAPISLVGSGTSWLTTPLSGLYTARQAMMSFRNDEQLDQLSQLINEEFRAKLRRGDFFQSVVFECPTPAAVSWTLSRQEQADIENGFAPGLVDPAYNEEALRNLERLGQLVRWWNRE